MMEPEEHMRQDVIRAERCEICGETHDIYDPEQFKNKDVYILSDDCGYQAVVCRRDDGEPCLIAWQNRRFARELATTRLSEFIASLKTARDIVDAVDFGIARDFFGLDRLDTNEINGLRAAIADAVANIAAEIENLKVACKLNKTKEKNQ